MIFATNILSHGKLFVNKYNYSEFSYIAYGPTESYIDKHVAAKYLEIDNLFCLSAEKDFSFSVNPYTTAQLRDTLHDFELPENDLVNVCIDVAMRGIGSHSCGPALLDRYEIPRKCKNTFKFKF